MNSDELPTQTPDAIEEVPFTSSAEMTQSERVEAPISEPEIELAQQIADLRQQEQILKQEIASLQAVRSQLQAQTLDAQTTLGRLVQDSLGDLDYRRQTLQIAVEQLERRQERIRNEMRTTFAGTSQDIAIRVQSFKDYLVGSLQDLALSAEQLEIEPRLPERTVTPIVEETQTPSPPRFAEQSFQEQTKKIRHLIDQFRNQPDYYGAVWQLRRTFEPIHAERVSNWFFTQGGRGGVRTMGSRLQNILVSSAQDIICCKIFRARV